MRVPHFWLRHFSLFVFALICVWLAARVSAAEPLRASFDSGKMRVPLVELFSSEGCDSCPPADAWFSRLRNDPGLWRDFIPVAFQVDYWNSLGWKDPLSSPEFTERQRAYAREWGSVQIYTPEYVADGAESEAWRSGKLALPAVKREVGNLHLERIPGGGFRFRVVFDPTEDVQSPSLSVAILGMDVAHDVKSGENRGRSLRHDFVVLQLKTTAARPITEAGRRRYEATVEFADAAKFPSAITDRAVAAWVTDGRTLKSIQAVGGALPDDVKKPTK